MGMDGGLRTIVAASSMEQYSLKFVFVEALQAKNGKQNQIAEVCEILNFRKFESIWNLMEGNQECIILHCIQKI